MQQRPPPSRPNPRAGSQPAAAEHDHCRDVTQLVEQQRTRVRRVLRARGVVERDLADAEQEVFLVVHRKLPEFEGRSSLATWLHRIAIHVASEHRRKARHRYEALAAAGVTPEPSTGDPEAQLEARDGLERVRVALEALSAEQRETFLLHEVVGLSMHEVAAQLHVPLKTAFSRFYAARRGLSAALSRRGIALSALWAWWALALPSRFAARARALAPKMLHGSSRAVQLPLACVVLLCSVLPPLAPMHAPPRPARNALSAPPARTLARTAPQRARSLQVEASTQRAPAAFANAARRAPLQPALRLPRRTRAAAVTPPDAPQAEPHAARADEAEDIVVTRAGAEDLRPQLESPLAAYVTPQRAASRITLHGPRDPVSALEESLVGSRLP